uniref:Uncharacterized protein n=1 Tax=Acrobeloides nanus TaxID=290746 RepID=A0A914CSQ3_9BILA
MGKLCRGCDRTVIENCWGCVEHDTTHESIGPSSRYIKVDKVGCFDCLSIVYTKCPANDFSNVGLPGWPSVVTFNPTLSNPHTSLVKRYEDPTRYMYWTFAIDHKENQTWAPYVIHPKILNREYATDAMKDILYECIWCKI